MYSMFDTAYNMGFADFARRMDKTRDPRTGKLSRGKYSNLGTRRALERMDDIAKNGRPYAPLPAGYNTGLPLPKSVAKKQRANSYGIFPKSPPVVANSSKTIRGKLNIAGSNVLNHIKKYPGRYGAGAAGLAVAGGAGLGYGLASRRKKRNRFGF